jgi:hypothetical protein
VYSSTQSGAACISTLTKPPFLVSSLFSLCSPVTPVLRGSGENKHGTLARALHQPVEGGALQHGTDAVALCVVAHPGRLDVLGRLFHHQLNVGNRVETMFNKRKQRATHCERKKFVFFIWRIFCALRAAPTTFACNPLPVHAPPQAPLSTEQAHPPKLLLLLRLPWLP